MTKKNRSQLDALPEDQDPSDLSIGNKVYRIRFDDRERRPAFGMRYFFFLQDAVEDVPEYVVHWDKFVQSVFVFLKCWNVVF